MGVRILAQIAEAAMSEELPIAKRKKISYERPYDPTPVVKRLKELLEKHNESYREAALACGLDHQVVRRILEGYRPSIPTCILLANHFDINPNELLDLAGQPTFKAFEIQTASADHLPPEAVDVALRISKIKDPGTRKKVAEAIQVLLQQYFE
jgi:transcriptional regulator with XRE-family HTH domain